MGFCKLKICGFVMCFWMETFFIFFFSCVYIFFFMCLFFFFQFFFHFFFFFFVSHHVYVFNPAPQPGRFSWFASAGVHVWHNSTDMETLNTWPEAVSSTILLVHQVKRQQDETMKRVKNIEKNTEILFTENANFILNLHFSNTFFVMNSWDKFCGTFLVHIWC